jgi:hypothetical protein
MEEVTAAKRRRPMTCFVIMLLSLGVLRMRDVLFPLISRRWPAAAGGALTHLLAWSGCIDDNLT